MLTTGAAQDKDVDLAGCAQFYFLAAYGSAEFSAHATSGSDAPLLVTVARGISVYHHSVTPLLNVLML